MGDAFDVRAWQASRGGLKEAVAITQPKQLTFWSKTSRRDGSRFLFGDASGLQTFREPALPVDLNAGFPDRYTAKEEGEGSPVDTIAQAAAAAGVKWENVDVCTYRNNLNKILLTPLNPRDGWAIDACKVGQTLFLEIVKAGADNKTWPGQDLMCYYGYKFEAVCTGDGEDVDATSEFASVVRYRLGRHRILMGAEIDAAAPGSEAKKEAGEARPQYVELKCFKLPGHARAEATIYAQKHPRWWVQSFLAGVQQLALGGRDEQGFLRQVHLVPVQQLPDLSARAGQPWDANRLLRFGDDLLAWMAERAAAAGEGAVVRCTHDPQRRAVVCGPAPAPAAAAPGMAARLGPLLQGGAAGA